MKNSSGKHSLSRRNFMKMTAGSVVSTFLVRSSAVAKTEAAAQNSLFSVNEIPINPYYSPRGPNNHAGIDCLLYLMGNNGLKFYRSNTTGPVSGPLGMIASNDVVLLKVNAQWKYRGATNSDLVRGLVQAILNHEDGFTGEIVIFENGQGRGSLNCDTSASYSDDLVHANALNESHSFLYLVDNIFKNSRVSAFLLDPIRDRFINRDDHVTNGYRIFENVSYPCFTTKRGNRVELREGLWNGKGYDQNLKLINVPVLKTHGGSEITASLKHFYGVLSMNDGNSGYRHYAGLGETCGKMVVSIRTPVLNLMDAIWVSYGALQGYPASVTFNANRIVAGQDPVALDYWAAKNILYPINKNYNHHPDNATIQDWLYMAQGFINNRGGLYNPQAGILVDRVTKNESEMVVYNDSATTFIKNGLRSVPREFRDRERRRKRF
jgi:Domain of unknown function (DUF362)